jgi:membrane-associated phospholipid phosphatase
MFVALIIKTKFAAFYSNDFSLISFILIKRQGMTRDWQLSIPWNIWIFRTINFNRHHILDAFYRNYFRLGKGYSFPVYLLFFAFWGGLEQIFCFFSGAIICAVIVRRMKWYFQHKRPGKLLKDVHNMEGFRSKSFPSGDGAYVFLVLAFGFYALGTIPNLFLLFNAILISYGRIYMGAHFPIDVLCGALVGVFSGISGIFLWVWLIEQYFYRILNLLI